MALIAVEPVSDTQTKVDAIKQLKLILELDPENVKSLNPDRVFFEEVKMADLLKTAAPQD
jgi:hypothetical protein